jgi:hypothetical protein
MAVTVFFSWQSDTVPTVGRNFIERAIERALGQLNADAELVPVVREEIELDRDTRGIPGSPPIVDTIFSKIDQAAVFIPDMTFVATRAGRGRTPNPNVLIEYGWALKSLGHHRILPVMNVAFGGPTENALPFDMRHLRHPLQYDCAPEADEEARRQTRDGLTKNLVRAIRDILGQAPLPEEVRKAASFVPRTERGGPGKFRESGAPLGQSSATLLLQAAASKDIFLGPGPATWLRLFPINDPGRIWTFNELKAAATSGGMLQPTYARGTNLDFIQAEDGFGVYVPLGSTSSETPMIVFAFETGEVWSTDTYLVGATEHSRSIPLEHSST